MDYRRSPPRPSLSISTVLLQGIQKWQPSRINQLFHRKTSSSSSSTGCEAHFRLVRTRTYLYPFGRMLSDETDLYPAGASLMSYLLGRRICELRYIVHFYFNFPDLCRAERSDLRAIIHWCRNRLSTRVLIARCNLHAGGVMYVSCTPPIYAGALFFWSFEREADTFRHRTFCLNSSLGDATLYGGSLSRGSQEGLPTTI